MGACTSSQPTVRERTIPAEERGFLVYPLSGYPLETDAAENERTRALFAQLEGGRPLADLQNDVQRFVAERADFAPAHVLRAQIDLLQDADSAAVDRLRPIVDEMPDYVAAALLLARAHDRRGDVVEAYELYQRLSEVDRLAASRATALADLAEVALTERVIEASEDGLFDVARLELERLERLSPGALSTLEARLRLNEMEGDAAGELFTLRRLVSIEPDFDRRLRLGELELEAGDLRAGLDIFQALAREAPDDLNVADQLARAKFLWRIELVPERVRSLARAPELSRGDLAVMLHWLVPPVRTRPIVDPPIAGDLLDHPDRAEILKVADQRLLSTDERVHRFFPDMRATRRATLGAVLGFLHADGETPPACAGLERPPASRICPVAASCGLIEETADCLHEATVSGPDAL
ncbi:MAG: hypothetical protein AAGN46_17910, partial [Acidobacteriota bacterium]